MTNQWNGEGFPISPRIGNSPTSPPLFTPNPFIPFRIPTPLNDFGAAFFGDPLVTNLPWMRRDSGYYEPPTPQTPSPTDSIMFEPTQTPRIPSRLLRGNAPLKINTNV